MSAEQYGHLAARVLLDALDEGARRYWERRARSFEAAQSRPGDFLGRAGEQGVRARDERLAATARACRQRAAMGFGQVEPAVVVELLDQGAA